MSDHDHSLLGPYVLGVLEPDEVREVDEHLSGCVEARALLAELEEMKQVLGEVPPEVFMDGPPADGDLVLQRTLHASRAIGRPAAPAVVVAKHPRWMLVAASIAVIAALGGGVLIGRQTVDRVATEAAVPGTKHVTTTDASTGATMATAVEPRTGWSYVEVRLTGLRAGDECELVVTDANGKTHVAGSWKVSEQAAREGSRFSGGVLVPIDQVTSVEVRTVQGTHVVTAPV